MQSSRSSKRPACTATGSLTATRHPDDSLLRDALLRTWEAWDEAPGNPHRANAFEDACNAVAGQAANDLRKALAARRRAGMSYAEAFDAWEQEW